MPYSPTLIANNILSRSFEEKCYMTPMKLQKILYFVASEYQKKTGRDLLTESFRAWDYGPVISSVFDEFRQFSKRDIKKFAKDATGQAYVIDESQDLFLKEALDMVWSLTKNRTAVDLSRITHAEGSAWDKAFQSDQAYLRPEDISGDTTYQRLLGLLSESG